MYTRSHSARVDRVCFYCWKTSAKREQRRKPNKKTQREEKRKKIESKRKRRTAKRQRITGWRSPWRSLWHSFSVMNAWWSGEMQPLFLYARWDIRPLKGSRDEFTWYHDRRWRVERLMGKDTKLDGETAGSTSPEISPQSSPRATRCLNRKPDSYPDISWMCLIGGWSVRHGALLTLFARWLSIFGKIAGITADMATFAARSSRRPTRQRKESKLKAEDCTRCISELCKASTEKQVINDALCTA